MTEEILISKGERVFSKRGSGPEKKICILLVKSDGTGCGLGDHIQSLPVIYELVRLGFDVTIYANEFYRSLYERAGCQFQPHTSVYFGCIDDLLPEYRMLYSMIEWSIDDDNATGGNSVTDRVSLFASWFGIQRPKTFNYVAALGAKTDFKLGAMNMILFAPQSTSSFRQIPREEQLFNKLKEKYPEVTWFGSKGKTGEQFVKELDSLIDLVYNAKAVFSADNGIMHLAYALGTPGFSVFGGTDERIVCEPYDFYNPDLASKRKYFRANPVYSHECVAPCSFHGRRGFGKQGKCKEFADCLMDIDKYDLLNAFDNFFQSTINLRSTT